MGKLMINDTECSGFGSKIYLTSGSSGGIQFETTELANNPTWAASLEFTLSGDYHDYDFVRFIVKRDGYGDYTTDIITTPDHIDKAFDLGSKFDLNEFGNNYYCCYTKNGATWTKSGDRTIFITKIIGYICTSHTVTETEIYSASARSSTAVSVDNQSDLLDYDLIFFSANSTRDDEVGPSIGVLNVNDEIISKPASDCRQVVFNGFNRNASVFVTNTAISSERFAYISGIKFV